MEIDRVGGDRRPGRRYNRTLGILRVAATLALVVALLALARPRPRSLAAGLLLLTLGEAIRFWAAGHLRKTVELITSGPYAHTRNPLYLGRLLIFAGLCVAATLPYAANWLVLGLGLATFFGYYLPRKEAVEPERLRRVHGDTYERYRRAVPALLPSPARYAAAAPGAWQLDRMLRNREHWMVLGLVAAAVWLCSRSAG